MDEMPEPPSFVPELEAIRPCKNKEVWHVPWHEDDKDTVRQWLCLRKCPFSGGECQHHNFQNGAVWSLEGPEKVLQYLMQHATHSGKHNLQQMDANQELSLAYDELEWGREQDTFEHRRNYRGQQRAQQPSGKGGTKRKRCDVGPDESASNVGSNLSASAMVEAVREAVIQGVKSVREADSAAEATSSADVWANVGNAVPAALPSSTGGPLAPLQLSVPSRAGDIPVPVEKLRMIQDNLQRAEHAMSSGLTSMVEAARKLDNERRIIKMTIDVVAKLTGVEPQHGRVL